MIIKMATNQECIERIKKNARETQLEYDKGHMSRAEYNTLNMQGKRRILELKKLIREGEP